MSTTADALSRRLRLRIDLQAIVYVLVLSTAVFFILYPALLIGVYSFHAGIPGEPFNWSLQGWRDALSQPGMLGSIWNTVRLLITVQVIALPTGVILAWLLARTDVPGKRWLEFFFWISFFLPTLSVTMGWIVMLDPSYGLINIVIRTLLPFLDQFEGPFNIYSYWGVVWAHLGGNAIAIKVMLLTPMFRNMDASLEEAARVAGSNRSGTLLRIVIPAMLPAILLVEMLSFIRAMQSFEIELVLGPPFNFFVYSTQIYRLVTDQPPNFAGAAALAVMGMAIILPLIFAQRWLVGRRRYTTISGKLQIQPTRLGPWRWVAFAAILLFAILLTAMPVGFVLMASFQTLFGFYDIAEPWTLGNWVKVLTDEAFIQAVYNTFRMAAGAAVLSVVMVSLIAYFVVRTTYWGRGLLDFVSWLPFAIPGVLLGVGLLAVFLGHAFLRPLYGSMWLMIFATVITSLTLGCQIVRTNLMQMGAELEEASRVAGGSWFYTFRRVVFPIIFPVLAVVAVLNFVQAARDISSVTLLATGSTKTLALLQLDFMTDGHNEPGAVVALVVIIISTGVALIARAFGLRIGIRE